MDEDEFMKLPMRRETFAELMEYLMAQGRDGLLMAHKVNTEIGASAERRGEAWPSATKN